MSAKNQARSHTLSRMKPSHARSRLPSRRPSRPASIRQGAGMIKRWRTRMRLGFLIPFAFTRAASVTP